MLAVHFWLLTVPSPFYIVSQSVFDTLQRVQSCLAHPLPVLFEVVAGLHECVYWYGEVTGENPQNAAISMARPGSRRALALTVTF